MDEPARRRSRWAPPVVITLALMPALGQAARLFCPLDAINMVLPALILALGLALITTGWRGRWWMALTCAAGLALAVGQLASAIGAAAPAQSGKATLTVLTASAYSANLSPDRFAADIAEVEADLILVQESDGTAARALAEALGDYHRVHSCDAPPCSLVILSRWPLERLNLLPGEKGPLPDLLAARVQAPSGGFVAINVHLPRPFIANAQRHREQVLRAAVRVAGERSLIGGDFNLPTGSVALAGVASHTRTRRLDRYISTYPGWAATPFGLPIDHIFGSPDWRSHGCKAMRLAGSDHRAVLCALS